MSIDILKQRLKKNEPSGVFAFFGEEEYLKSYYTKKLVSYADKSPTPEFNYVTFNDETVSIDALRDAIDTPPFMWEYKAILVNGLPLSNKALFTSLCEICDDIPDGVILIFSFKAGDIDTSAYKKKKDKSAYVPFLECIERFGLCVEFEKQGGAKLFDWISRVFASKNVGVTREAVEFLPAYCGNDMTVLISEIEKLCSYRSDSDITVSDVEFVCCPNAEYQIFDLASAVVERNASKTRAIMQNFRFNSVAPELIMGSISKNFCDMLYVKTNFAENKNPSDVKNAIGMPDWLYRRILASASKTDVKTLERIVLACSDADRKLKSFSGDPYTVLELLFCEISHGKA